MGQDSPNITISPKDRLWFKENCRCAGKVGCGNMGSERFGRRFAEAKAEADGRAVRAEQDRAANAARAAKDDADRRAHPDKFCPGWRDRGTYGTGGAEASALFKKYCSKWAVEDAARIAADEARIHADKKRLGEPGN